MPMHELEKNGEKGYKWGDSGKEYYGQNAKHKAMQQMKAIKSSQEREAKAKGLPMPKDD